MKEKIDISDGPMHRQLSGGPRGEGSSWMQGRARPPARSNHTRFHTEPGRAAAHSPNELEELQGEGDVQPQMVPTSALSPKMNPLEEDEPSISELVIAGGNLDGPTGSGTSIKNNPDSRHQHYHKSSDAHNLLLGALKQYKTLHRAGAGTSSKPQSFDLQATSSSAAAGGSSYYCSEAADADVVDPQEQKAQIKQELPPIKQDDDIDVLLRGPADPGAAAAPGTTSSKGVVEAELLQDLGLLQNSPGLSSPQSSKPRVESDELIQQLADLGISDDRDKVGGGGPQAAATTAALLEQTSKNAIKSNRGSPKDDPEVEALSREFQEILLDPGAPTSLQQPALPITSNSTATTEDEHATLTRQMNALPSVVLKRKKRAATSAAAGGRGSCGEAASSPGAASPGGGDIKSIQGSSPGRSFAGSPKKSAEEHPGGSSSSSRGLLKKNSKKSTSPNNLEQHELENKVPLHVQLGARLEILQKQKEQASTAEEDFFDVNEAGRAAGAPVVGASSSGAAQTNKRGTTTATSSASVTSPAASAAASPHFGPSNSSFIPDDGLLPRRQLSEQVRPTENLSSAADTSTTATSSSCEGRKKTRRHSDSKLANAGDKLRLEQQIVAAAGGGRAGGEQQQEKIMKHNHKHNSSSTSKHGGRSAGQMVEKMNCGPQIKAVVPAAEDVYSERLNDTRALPRSYNHGPAGASHHQKRHHHDASLVTGSITELNHGGAKAGSFQHSKESDSRGSSYKSKQRTRQPQHDVVQEVDRAPAFTSETGAWPQQHDVGPQESRHLSPKSTAPKNKSSSPWQEPRGSPPLQQHQHSALKQKEKDSSAAKEASSTKQVMTLQQLQDQDLEINGERKSSNERDRRDEQEPPAKNRVQKKVPEDHAPTRSPEQQHQAGSQLSLASGSAADSELLDRLLGFKKTEMERQAAKEKLRRLLREEKEASKNAHTGGGEARSRGSSSAAPAGAGGGAPPASTTSSKSKRSQNSYPVYESSSSEDESFHSGGSLEHHQEDNITDGENHGGSSYADEDHDQDDASSSLAGSSEMSGEDNDDSDYSGQSLPLSYLSDARASDTGSMSSGIDEMLYRT
ncbi:unnamed protein product [Amoebophrya sp. A120]|nr:unnamed protein product [Amoebophrya sp. A120]|eukprot:GSA120T00015839001.1